MNSSREEDIEWLGIPEESFFLDETFLFNKYNELELLEEKKEENSLESTKDENKVQDFCF